MNKIWVLGGAFYLSLFILVIGFWIGDKKLKKYLSRGVIICAAILAIYFSLTEFSKLNYDPKLFFRPIISKEDQMTAGAYSYSEHLRKILPISTRGCIFQSTDLPAYYLRSQLYPRKFSLVQTLSKNCQYIVSQFAPVEIEGFVLIDKFEDSYLYKLEN